MRLTLYFDGSAHPNAKDVGGVRGIGVVLEGAAGVVKEVSEKLPGLGSSNSAEYEALHRGLLEAKKLGADEVVIRGDSQLVIRQIEGRFRVTSEKIRPLHERVVKLANEFKSIELQWVPREQNKRADKLSNDAVVAGSGPAATASEEKYPSTKLGSSPSKREHDTLCPKCRKPCVLKLETGADGKERIRQSCLDHGFVCWAPLVEPFLTLARGA